jgi:hypothetical protein
MDELEDLVDFSPEEWPGVQLDVQPGDLSRFAAQGIALAGPPPAMPWDDPAAAEQRADYYAAQARAADPFLNAPITRPCGGTVYFDGDVEPDDLRALLRLLHVYGPEKQYAAFLGYAENTEEEGYVVQIRIVNRFGLRFRFRAIGSEEYDAFPEQPLSIEELVLGFVRHQQETWGIGMDGRLQGAMGGDGDYAREALAFGFMVENDYHGIYRIWSRAWLVTK